jgi:hypothetical protein
MLHLYQKPPAVILNTVQSLPIRRDVEPDILDTKVISQKGCYRRIRRWLRGAHPERGTIVKGLMGIETVEELDQIMAMHTFFVKEAPSEWVI